MAWNEPGGSGKDPWGGGKKSQGPPDLDEVVRKMQQKIGGLFGNRGGGGGGGSGFNSSIILLVGVIALVVWALSGIYIVDAAEKGIVLRFGQYNETSEPGLHWRIPYPVDTVMLVNVKEINNIEVGFSSAGSNLQESLMLTQDENIIDIQLAVQYKIGDPVEYLFNVQDPDATLKQVTESALREVVGKSKMDFVLTDGRVKIQQQVEELTQKIIQERYKTGLLLTRINIQNAQPPAQVQAAFADAVKAREDKQRFINDAEAYKNEKLPLAKGNAARQLEASLGYLGRVIEQSKGEAERFLSVLREYEKAPRVTRERLYLDTFEEVMGNVSKVLIDVKGGNNVLFLPLDRLMSGMRDKVVDLNLPNRSNERSDSLRSSNGTFGSRDNSRNRRERR